MNINNLKYFKREWIAETKPKYLAMGIHGLELFRCKKCNNIADKTSFVWDCNHMFNCDCDQRIKELKCFKCGTVEK